MREEELAIDRKYHVIYSKECKQAILKYIAKHYPKEEINSIFEKVQQQYVSYLKDYRKDLGGKKNFHNGVGGTYDCIAVFCYYKVCRDVTSFDEIEELYASIFMPSFEKLSFANANHPLIRRILYFAFKKAEKRCEKWDDYKMEVQPLKKGEPIRYRFTSCPVAEFAHEHDLLDILPALCNVDYPALECMQAKLVRTTTLGYGLECDYAICGNQDPYLKEHEEYRDEKGYRRNR